MEFYVVMTSRPGPGARALVGEALGSALDHDPETRDRVLRAADAACEFVEVEDVLGNGYGPERSGADWHDRRDGFVALGPLAKVEG